MSFSPSSTRARLHVRVQLRLSPSSLGGLVRVGLGYLGRGLCPYISTARAAVHCNTVVRKSEKKDRTSGNSRENFPKAGITTGFARAKQQLLSRAILSVEIIDTWSSRSTDGDLCRDPDTQDSHRYGRSVRYRLRCQGKDRGSTTDSL